MGSNTLVFLLNIFHSFSAKGSYDDISSQISPRNILLTPQDTEDELGELPVITAAQGNYDNNSTQIFLPRIDFSIPAVDAPHSIPSIREVSPSVGPRCSDEELEELPDVIALRIKRRLRRQSSKERQTNGQY